VAASAGQAKSLAIRRMFGIGRLNVNWTLPSRLGDNPLIWKIVVNGTLVDIRQESRERQEAAFQQGLIPYIPADRTTIKDKQASKPPDSPSLGSIEGGLFGGLFGFHKKTMAMLRAANLDDDKLDIAAERISLLMGKANEEIERTHDLNIQPRLDAMYEEVKRLVDELSQSPNQNGSESP